jgi:hypothetical protein
MLAILSLHHRHAFYNIHLPLSIPVYPNYPNSQSIFPTTWWSRRTPTQAAQHCISRRQDALRVSLDRSGGLEEWNAESRTRLFIDISSASS